MYGQPPLDLLHRFEQGVAVFTPVAEQPQRLRSHAQVASVTKLAFGNTLNFRGATPLPSTSTASSTNVIAPLPHSNSHSFVASPISYLSAPAPVPAPLPAENSLVFGGSKMPSSTSSAAATQQQQHLNQSQDLFLNFDFGPMSNTTQQHDDLTKAFMEDFMTMPLDYDSTTLIAPPIANNNNNSNMTLPPFDPSALPQVSPHLHSPREQAANFDQGLDSPLGFDSPCSEAAFFDDDDLDELPPLDFDTFVDVPISTESGLPSVPVEAELPQLLSLSSTTPSVLITPSPTDSFSESIAPTPSISESSSSSSATTTSGGSKTRTRRSKATGFRGVHTKLTAIDAPIQQRNYLVPSVTSRKRKTTAVERELAKRVQIESTPLPIPSSMAIKNEEVEEEAHEEAGEGENDLPQDLVVAVEKKRLQNTLSARKSRQRKQERLAELEIRNKELEDDKRKLQERVRELEEKLAMTGLF